MKLSLSPFHAELPRLNPKTLPDPHATLALNCDLENMTLKPAHGAVVAASVLAETQSIYRHDLGQWFTWDQPGVDAVASPLNNDAHDRIYWTGDGPARMTTFALATSGGNIPAVSYKLGIPEPGSSLSVSADTVSDDDFQVDAVYSYTFVSEYGEEGPPAPASALIARSDSTAVELTGIGNPPTGDHNIITKRIYRAETGGQFLKVVDLPVASTEFTDEVPTSELGQPLESTTWDMPDPRMIGLTNVGNGILIGWFDNTLCACEPYRPHAWPVGYQLGFDGDIVGVAPFNGGLIVVTTVQPWLVTGSSPAAWVQQPSELLLGAVGRHSVVSMGDYVLYASEEGLVAAPGGQNPVITQQMISREQWAEFNPDTIHAYRWHDRYLAFYQDNGGDWQAFLLHPEHGLIRLEPDAEFAAGYFDPRTGELFMLADNGDIHTWDQGDDKPYTWRSKVFTLPHRATLACAKVDCAEPVQIRFMADGDEILNIMAPADQMFRLPPGRYRDWQIELSGTTEVLGVQVASSPRELL